jgi:hypothetical protein
MMALYTYLPLFLHFLAFLLPVVVCCAYVPPGAVCQDYIVNLDVSVSALKYAGPKWSNNYELMDFNSIGGSRLDAGFPAPLTGSMDYNDSVTISGTFCTPAVTWKGHERTVLLATHGIGFDRR